MKSYGDSMALKMGFHGIYDDIPGLVISYIAIEHCHRSSGFTEAIKKNSGSFQFAMLSRQGVEVSQILTAWIPWMHK